VDAGPQHLAHGLGVPSLTLYGPMAERRWSDYWRRPIHRTVRAGACDLTPEERRGLAVNHEVLLIRPETVFPLLQELMSKEIVVHEVV
jgi:ADP-heptose:LPS heptosyltransferase